MEILSYSTIADDEMVWVQKFLSEVTIVGLSNNVKNEAIALREKYRLKLPDAIVCATTLGTC